MLHRERDCCSNDNLFKRSLEELKTVLLRNSYPEKLINSKIRIFMADDQKPIRPERVHTLCLDFSSFSMEPYINNLLKKMQKVIPTFRVNVAYKSIPVSSLFFTDSKAATPPHETSNVCYEFTCECKSSYIGHTARPLTERMREHQQFSNAKGIYWHMKTCPEYQETQIKWKPPEKMTLLQKNFAFFTSHFRIQYFNPRGDTDLSPKTSICSLSGRSTVSGVNPEFSPLLDKG